jgi:hypothetical protein
MSPRIMFGSAAPWVRSLVEEAQSGGTWYRSADGSVSLVELDEDKFWAGTVYDVAFQLTDTGYGEGGAASWVMDISEDEAISPNSSSPWNGWAGWQDDQLTVAWQNPEVGTQGAVTTPLDFALDDHPTDEQWALLARRVTEICFTSS